MQSFWEALHSEFPLRAFLHSHGLSCVPQKVCWRSNARCLRTQLYLGTTSLRCDQEDVRVDGEMFKMAIWTQKQPREAMWRGTGWRHVSPRSPGTIIERQEGSSLSTSGENTAPQAHTCPPEPETHFHCFKPTSFGHAPHVSVVLRRIWGLEGWVSG